MIKVSPSQVSAFESCPRQWGLPILDGAPSRPQHPSAALGERVHKVVEDWMKDGTPLPKTEEGKIAMPTIRHLPAPGVADVEKKWSFHEPDGDILFNGRKDGRWPGSDAPLVLFDLKTTGNLQWALDENTLAEDVQALTYAEAEFRADPTLERLELFWLYATTKGKKKAVPVRIIVTREYVREAFQRIHATAKLMADIRRAGGSALDLPPNASHCSAFGGCPYAGKECVLTPEERLSSIMAKESLLEAMKRRAQEKKAAQAAAEVEDETVVETGMCSCGTVGELDAKGMLTPHKKPDGKACRGGKAPLPADEDVEPAAINPPEAPKVAKATPKTPAPAPAGLTDLDARAFLIIEAMDPVIVQRARNAAERLG